MKWKLVPVEPDDSTLSAMHEKMYDVRGLKWHDGMSAVYMAGVNAAPTPPKLSDERISHHLDAILKASGSGLKNYSMHKTIEEMKQVFRAIEREILGEIEK